MLLLERLKSNTSKERYKAYRLQVSLGFGEAKNFQRGPDTRSLVGQGETVPIQLRDPRPNYARRAKRKASRDLQERGGGLQADSEQSQTGRRRLVGMD